jgi:low affinity Fe/Cu permease
MTLYDASCRLSERIAASSGHPLAQGAFLLVCVLWWLLGGDMLVLTTLLSVVAITLSQMVLASQRREAAALKLQMAELVRALPGARNEIAEADKLSEREIEELRQ